MTPTEAAGAQIGRYKLLEKIGEGGMGTIWMAEQREPVRRRVALKIIKLGMDKGLHHSVVQLMSEAFAADPRIADDLGAPRRHDAAVSAALASAGRSKDSAQLDERARTRLRTQAVDWLRADLALHAKKLETGKPEDRAATTHALREWQEDSDLACIRDPAALASLPTEDRNALGQLWADVAALATEAERQSPAEHQH